MFNIAGNLSPPLTVLELPFSHRLPRLSSGPNMLCHYIPEEKKRKSPEAGRDSDSVWVTKLGRAFYPLSVCRNKITYMAELLNCCYLFETPPLWDALGCMEICFAALGNQPHHPSPFPYPQPEPGVAVLQTHSRAQNLGVPGTEQTRVLK